MNKEPQNNEVTELEEVTVDLGELEESVSDWHDSDYQDWDDGNYD